MTTMTPNVCAKKCMGGMCKSIESKVKSLVKRHHSDTASLLQFGITFDGVMRYDHTKMARIMFKDMAMNLNTICG